MSKTFAEQAITFHQNLNPQIQLKNGVEWIRAYEREETMSIFKTFMKRFYDDKNKRYFLFGINPGRFGSGLTGVAFTDPILLENKLGISSSFEKKHELSALFIYEVIEELTIEKFYQNFYISSVNPLGLLKDNKNYNYYDDSETLELVKPFIIDSINKQVEFGAHREEAFSIGQGKNLKVLSALNKDYNWFKKITPLPHPRWVMQYRRKTKQNFIDEYVEKLIPKIQ